MQQHNGGGPMKRSLSLAILIWILASSAAVAACPGTSLTLKDAGGTTQTICFGGSSGAFIPQYQILDAAGVNALGINGSGQITITAGCAGATVGNTTSTPISITASGQIITGTSGKQTYVCSINLITSTADNIALVEGTGSACATSVAGMAGGATAATGWNLASNGGLTLGNGQGIVARTATLADNVCLLVSSAAQVSGSIVWAQF